MYVTPSRQNKTALSLQFDSVSAEKSSRPLVADCGGRTDNRHVFAIFINKIDNWRPGLLRRIEYI